MFGKYNNSVKAAVMLWTGCLLVGPNFQQSVKYDEILPF